MLKQISYTARRAYHAPLIGMAALMTTNAHAQESSGVDDLSGMSSQISG